MFTVRFLPEQRTLEADEPLDLSLAASRCEIWLEQPCGSRTVCGRCRVRVVAGAAAITPADRRLIAPADLDAGWRLGCQLALAGPITIDIPRQIRGVPPKSFGGDAIDPPARPAFDLPDNRARVLGIAVDLGTTTLAAALVDLRDGRVLATAAGLNPQARHGADVIARIHLAGRDPAGNLRLHDDVASGVASLVRELTASAGVAADDVWAVTCAGNATMTHTAVGADITSLGEAPFLGAFTGEQEVPASSLGLPVRADARVRFLPLIRSHVGGDTVAAVLACGLDRAERPHVLIDLGTNAEVVVGCRHHLAATSTAAGPAFEGGHVSCGMRAAPGAIDAVRVGADGRLLVGTVAGRPPRGICGSGLVDVVAELLRARVVAPSGYLRGRDECAALGVPVPLQERLVEEPGRARAVRLSGGITLDARDIRQLQLVKGSIAAGVTLMLDAGGLGVNDLEGVLVAGVFGSFLRKSSAIALGLVPAVDPERVHFVGNAAGAGARLALVDGEARQRAARIAQDTEYVELAGHPDYEEAFLAALAFPPCEDGVAPGEPAPRDARGDRRDREGRDVGA